MNEFLWAKLNHDSVLTLVEATIQQKLSNLFLIRNSYINRVYELELAETKERLIVKFYRPNRWSAETILTEHRFLAQLFAEEIPVIPPMIINGKTLFNGHGIFFAVFPKKGGRALDELDKSAWQQVGRLLGRVHQNGARLDKPNRITWRPQIATAAHLAILKDTQVIPQDYQVPFFKVTQALIDKIDSLFIEQDFILLHGDCHLGNLINRAPEGIYIIDFDDMSMGPAVQDLWMLLPDTVENCENEIAWFIEGYQTFCDFPKKTLELIPALRAMRLIHFASWCAIQAQEPGFHIHFPQWGTTPYWNETIKQLQTVLYESSSL